MRDPINGDDTGNMIARTGTRATCPWPDDMPVQGGTGGLVVGWESGDTYSTAFVEAFPPSGFIRGEGRTVTDAEKACWRAYQSLLSCPGPTGQHDWQPHYTTGGGRLVNYHNGAAFCSHCRSFRARHFTAEQLGQKCAVCDAFTLFSFYPTDGPDMVFLCEQHRIPFDVELATRHEGRFQAALSEHVAGLRAERAAS